jgi:MFS family permease
MSHWKQMALSLYWFATQAQWATILIILLPAQAEKIGGEANKGATLGIIVLIGAFVSMLTAPLVGAWSDRVRARWGRRKPFIFWGTLANIAGLLILATIPAAPGKLVPYIIAFAWLELASNFASAPYSALIPDVVPPAQRGSASGWMGLMMMLGNLAGIGCGLFARQIGGDKGAYLILAGLLLIGMLFTVIAIREPEPPPMAPFSWREFADMLRPFGASDFRWVFFTRFLVMLGTFTVQELLQFYMRDIIAGGRTTYMYLQNFLGTAVEDAKGAAAVFSLMLLVGAVASTFIAGALSDKYGRKLMVYLSGAIQGAITLAMLFTGNFGLALIFGLIFGIGYGAYQAVDWALVTDVLPNADDAAKDMGVWHIAVTLPQVIATPIAGVMLDHGQRVGQGHGIPNLGYIIVFAIAVAYFTLGTVLVRNIKGAR